MEAQTLESGLRTDEVRLRELLDREELFDLVRRERLARDRRRFTQMRECFHEDAFVSTSWYHGTGADAYVEATRKWMGDRQPGTHWVFPAYADICGDRATVESPAMIASRPQVHGIEVDVIVICRFFSRAVRVNGYWKLLTFRVIFERDIMRPVHHDQTLPIDRDVLTTLRPSYKFIGYLQTSRGVKLNPDHLGDDRPAELEAFYAGESAWVRGGERQAA
jgi:hypothetical protein